MPDVLGLDLGGTVVKAAVVTESGEVSGLVTDPSAEADGPEAWAQRGLDVAARALADSGRTPAALGLSVPGAVDPATGTLLDLGSRLGTGPGLALGTVFAPLGAPVYADNDARAALLAERRWGLARDVPDVVLLTLGTGLGGAALVGGEVFASADPLVGNQLGHFTVDLHGPRCVCGNVGCAETYASATGLRRLAREAGCDDASPSAVLTAVSRGEARAARAATSFVSALAAAIVNAIHAYQPSLVVLGGGVAWSAPHFLPRLTELVTERAWTLPRGRVRLAVSPLNAQLGVLGAAAVAFEHTAELTTRRAS